MNYAQFYEQICSLVQDIDAAKFDLSNYLLALLSLTHKYAGKPINAQLLMQILRESFYEAPTKFDEAWLNLSSPPDDEIWLAKFTNPELNLSSARAKINYPNGLAYTQEVIKFQLAELAKMRQSGDMDNKMRYFGLASPTGNIWYNFDPATILECGARGLLDSTDDETSEPVVSWQTLGELLEIGRIYE